MYKFDLNQQLDKGRQVISVQNQKKSIFNNSMQNDQIEVQDEEDDDEQEQQQFDVDLNDFDCEEKVDINVGIFSQFEQNLHANHLKEITERNNFAQRYQLVQDIWAHSQAAPCSKIILV